MTEIGQFHAYDCALGGVRRMRMTPAAVVVASCTAFALCFRREPASTCLPACNRIPRDGLGRPRRRSR